MYYQPQTNHHPINPTEYYQQREEDMASLVAMDPSEGGAVVGEEGMGDVEGEGAAMMEAEA